MQTDTVPEQPAVRSGEAIAATGRWNLAALRRIQQLGQAEVQWISGPLGRAAVINGVVVGRIHRSRPEQPWRVKVEGFERWHAPTRVIKHWHYTPVWAITTLAEAKRDFVNVVRSLPDLADE